MQTQHDDQEGMRARGDELGHPSTPYHRIRPETARIRTRVGEPLGSATRIWSKLRRLHATDLGSGGGGAWNGMQRPLLQRRPTSRALSRPRTVVTRAQRDPSQSFDEGDLHRRVSQMRQVRYGRGPLLLCLTTDWFGVLTDTDSLTRAVVSAARSQ